ncbi:Hypothetical predicted protein [Cloeon dipterum]|uniref:Uncharacterized protein n=1 Tax=Cloeon dipterum TaxID=197152 RepID=A0A8S1DTY9_9INSE|nr:Hypothetical predicted protein [Cloeon dipterum]
MFFSTNSKQIQKPLLQTITEKPRGNLSLCQLSKKCKEYPKMSDGALQTSTNCKKNATWSFYKRDMRLKQCLVLCGWTHIGEVIHVARVLQNGYYLYGYLDRNKGYFVKGNHEVVTSDEVELLVGCRYFWIPAATISKDFPKNLRPLALNAMFKGCPHMFLGQAFFQGELLSGPVDKDVCLVPTKDGVKRCRPITILCISYRGNCGKCGEDLKVLNKFYYHVKGSAMMLRYSPKYVQPNDMKEGESILDLANLDMELDNEEETQST